MEASVSLDTTNPEKTEKQDSFRFKKLDDGRELVVVSGEVGRAIYVGHNLKQRLPEGFLERLQEVL